MTMKTPAALIVIVAVCSCLGHYARDNNNEPGGRCHPLPRGGSIAINGISLGMGDSDVIRILGKPTEETVKPWLSQYGYQLSSNPHDKLDILLLPIENRPIVTSIAGGLFLEIERGQQFLKSGDVVDYEKRLEGSLGPPTGARWGCACAGEIKTVELVYAQWEYLVVDLILQTPAQADCIPQDTQRSMTCLEILSRLKGRTCTIWRFGAGRRDEDWRRAQQGSLNWQRHRTKGGVGE